MKNGDVALSICCGPGEDSLPEYVTKEEEDGTMTCYIPSKSGEVSALCFGLLSAVHMADTTRQNFSFSITNSSKDALSVYLRFDGIALDAGGFICRANDEGSIKGVPVSVDERKRFMFSDLKLTGMMINCSYTDIGHLFRDYR